MKKIRKKINKIDKKLSKNILKRYLLIDQVVLFKRKNNILISDKQRENDILNKYDNLKLRNFFKNILSNSKKYQQNLINNKALLLGNNISYSKSTLIHNLISKKLKNNLEYEVKDIIKQDIQTYIQDLKNYNYSFFNITIPFKNEILNYLDYTDNIVLNTGSCNLVLLKDEKVYGYNTDYYGALYMLSVYNFSKTDQVYIFGSGATSNLLKYLFNKVYQINPFLVSRTKQDLTNNIITYDTFYKMDKKNYILINATPLGNLNYLNQSPVSKDIAEKAKYLFDLNYNPRLSLFLSYNKNSQNGLKMLIAQAFYAQLIYNQLEFKDIRKIDEILKEIEEEYDRQIL